MSYFILVVETMEFTFLNDLKPWNSSSVIRVRCVRVYEFLKPGDKSNVISLECIFHDRMVRVSLLTLLQFLSYLSKPLTVYFSTQGTRIQGTLPHYLQNKFQDHIKEGSVVNICFFFARRNRVRTPITDHAFVIAMCSKTRISKVDDSKFPRFMYSFKTFDLIKQITKMDEEPLFGIF